MILTVLLPLGIYSTYTMRYLCISMTLAVRPSLKVRCPWDLLHAQIRLCVRDMHTKARQAQGSAQELNLKNREKNILLPVDSRPGVEPLATWFKIQGISQPATNSAPGFTVT